MGEMFQVRWYQQNARGKTLISSDHNSEKGAKNKARDKSSDPTTFESRAQVARIKVADVDASGGAVALESWTFEKGKMVSHEEEERKVEVTAISEVAIDPKAKPMDINPEPVPEDEPKTKPAKDKKSKAKNVTTPVKPETETEGETDMAAKPRSKKGEIMTRFEKLREGSNREVVLSTLAGSLGKKVTKAKLAEAVYGKNADENMGAFNMVMKGVKEVVEKAKGLKLEQAKDGKEISFVLTETK